MFSGNPDRSYAQDLRRLAEGLSKPANADTPASKKAQHAFGPVVERVISFDRSFIDFQTGSVLRPDWNKIQMADLLKWMEHAGTDAMAEEVPNNPHAQPHNFPGS